MTAPYFVGHVNRNSMKTTIGNLVVELTQNPNAGTAWSVRVYRKMLFFKRRVSSDWFLDEDQARQFAENVVEELRQNSTLEKLRGRNPGWTFRRPA
jgi:hypothetical protein